MIQAMAVCGVGDGSGMTGELCSSECIQLIGRCCHRQQIVSFDQDSRYGACEVGLVMMMAMRLDEAAAMWT